MKNYKGLTAFGIALSVVGIVLPLTVFGVVGTKLLPSINSTNGNHHGTSSEEYVLDAPVNVNYNLDTSMITWDRVYNAEMYDVIIDNKEPIRVNTNSYYYLSKDYSFNIAIVAIDGDGDIGNSPNSDVLAVEIPHSTLNLQSAFIFANKIGRENDELRKLLSVNYSENKAYVSGIYYNDTIGLHYECHTVYFDTTVLSLLDAFERPDGRYNHSREMTARNFNSAGPLLESKAYAVELEKLRVKGCRFAILDQITYEVEDEVGIDAIYLVDKGSEQFMVRNVTHSVPIGSVTLEEKFIDSIKDPSRRNVKEMYHHEYKDDEDELERLLFVYNIDHPIELN